ncbi:uncharacterized protein BX663DRAFT_511671 [Cokeromyces recurvatus]|uniref:uncharacterized protein n=1 Tax=Cokeromyces recurvatus TaxID=90255 RepID=UPI0022208ECB|nr:uncharacterized protein BX663DRAFT_511671 [Cokeromyces recurvatus]KAI7902077.1 hypothetical protein BX663DRAFT_511671 [Cokeromyces recurvatus]
MGLYEEIKEEIHSSLLSLTNKKEKITWNAFIQDIQQTILSKYNNQNIDSYKKSWKHCFKTAAKYLELQIDHHQRKEGDKWKELIVNSLSTYTPTQISSIRTTFSKSTSTLEYQKMLTNSDIILLQNNHNKITKKWSLSSGRNVEDVLFNASKCFKFEHPGHSYILDLNDEVWKNYFSSEEMAELHSHKDNALIEQLPIELNEMLQKLNGKATFREIYDVYQNVEADPVEDIDKFWIKQSILNYVLLFVDSDEHDDYGKEQDLLHGVYGFIKQSKRLSKTKVISNTGSQSSADCKNSLRSIGSIDKICKQAPGDRPDLCFTYLSNEIGCLEIGLTNRGTNGTKEINENNIKIPIMLKSFHYRIATQYNISANKTKVIGFIISGMYISGLVMTFNNGSVSLISRSRRMKMPETVAEIPLLLPPVLKLIYNASQTMKGTIDFIKEIFLNVSLDELDVPYFPPCFAVCNLNKKRKTSISN